MADRRSKLSVRLRSALPTPRRNPFALGYLAVLLGTTLFARFGDPVVVERLQGYSSSDAHNLLSHPVGSLLLSGIWVAGPVWMPYFWAFAVTVAPLERRVGGLRAAGAFAAGHVLATLLSQAVVLAAVAAGRQDGAALDGLDIGVSYGVLASLGALAGLLTLPGRLCALAAAGGLIGHQFLDETDLVTGVGHPAALLVGVALWPWLRRTGGRGPGLARRPQRRLEPSEA
ncbi:rhomboid-like protein [Kitasatospora sp. NPDC096147]|uniref:rhomboid-like protein n=1 Tax=Kitasatospora sp. NPDC096147 TaxID=3364093 RepID=UPI003810DAA2